MASVSLLAAAKPRRNHAQNEAAFDEVLRNVLQPGGYSDQLNEVVSDHVRWAQATKRRRAVLVARFTKMHKEGRWSGYSGREFAVDDILARAKDCLTIIVHASESVDDPSKRMRWSSFNLTRSDMFSLMVAYCVDARGDTALHAKWNHELQQHARLVAETAGIPRDRKPKFYFGPAEVLLMAETALTSSEASIDTILQNVALWTVMFYTAARPGSIIATDNYLGSYLRFQDITISRTETRLAFNVEINIVAWKGGHGLDTWSQSFRLSPVQSESHLIIEPGLLFLIVGLRRGAFRDHSTLESILSGKEISLRWKDEWLSRPVFCGGKPRGLGQDFDKPMRYHAFRTFLKATCVQAGLGDEHMSAYCFRRGSATTMTRVLGGELTKAILHHKQHSETLQRSYAYNSTQQDLTSAILYDTVEQAVGRSKYDAPALYRPMPNGDAVTKRLSFEEALTVSSDLRLLHMQRLLLREVIQIGGGAEDAPEVFETLLPPDRAFYDQLATSQPEDQEGLVQMLYGRISVRCRRLFSDMQARFQHAQTRQNFSNAQLPTFADLSARLARMATNHALVSVLDRLRETCSVDPNGESLVIACPALDASEDGGPDSDDFLVLWRERFARALVDHVSENRSAQVCRICHEDPALPKERRNKVYSSKWKVNRHVQQVHRYLVAKPLLDGYWYDSIATLCGIDSVY